MAIPRGSHYVPGSGRRQVELSNGDIVSRQRAENMFAQQFGFRSEYHRKQTANVESYRDFVNNVNGRDGYNKAMAEMQANGYTRAEANAVLANFYSDPQGNAVDRSPEGPLAQMLVAMGRRSPNDTHFVGDSPSIM